MGERYLLQESEDEHLSNDFASQFNAPAHTAGPSHFIRNILGDLPRADQRRWAAIYLLGLVKVSGRKSIRNIAEFAGMGAAVQSLQQFINQSPWDSFVVRRKIAQYLLARLPALAWTVKHAVIPKRGNHSVGVARRFVPSAGRIVNCQLGVGLHLVFDTALVPVDWRLVLSPQWTEQDDLRTRCRIPDNVTARSEHDLAVDMITGMAAAAGQPSLPVLIDLTTEPDPHDRLITLADNGIDFLAEISPDTTLLPGTHLRPVAAGQAWSRQRQPRSARECAAAAVDTELLEGPDVVQIAGAPAGLAGDGTARVVRVLRTSNLAEDRFWVTTVLNRPLRALANLIVLNQRGARDLQLRQDRFGVRDFEGRSFQGWHHHMTMASAAQALAVLGARRDR